MKQKTKKILSVVGLAVFGISILLGTVVYIFVDCLEEDNIKRNTLYCYFCISSNIKNFPLIGLVGEPVYYVNQNFPEPRHSHPPQYNVEFASNEEKSDLLEKGSKFIKANGFRIHREYPDSIEFIGNNSLFIMRVWNDSKCKVGENNIKAKHCVRVDEIFAEKGSEVRFLNER